MNYYIKGYGRRFIITTVLSVLCFYASGQSRNTVILDKNWKFIVDSSRVGLNAGWNRSFPENSLAVSVPHTWNVTKNLEDYYGMAWYQKDIMVPAGWKNKNIRVRFGAVYHDAVIYVNGRKVMQHMNSGYTAFYADISDYVKVGEKNSLVVSVDNSFSDQSFPFMKSFDYPNDGGIIREVELQASDRPSIRYVHVDPLIDFKDTTGTAVVKIRLWEDDVKNGSFTISIKEKNSATAALSQTLQLSKTGNEFVTRLDLKKIKLWHFDLPELYQVTVAVNKNRKISDQVSDQFGFREIRISGSKLLFNNEPVRLPGLEYMPSSYPDFGAAEPKWVMDSVMNLFNDLNVKISRFHWQVDRHMLDLMDEKGLLVQVEIPWWQRPTVLTPQLLAVAKQQLVEMIESDYNHPSIFAWGVSNEVYVTTTDQAEYDKLMSQYKELISLSKSLDPNRMANIVSATTPDRGQKAETLLGDFPTWNDYVGTWAKGPREDLPNYLSRAQALLGGRPLFITEAGLCEPYFSGGDQRRISDMIYHYNEWAQRDYIAGAIYFCLNDYRSQMGEDGKGRFKARIHGLTDLYFNKKPSYYVYKQLASPILISQIKKINDSTVKITLKNKNTLPSYTIKGYQVKWNAPDGTRMSKEIPVLKPGESTALELTNMQARFVFDIVSYAGTKISGYPAPN